MSRSGNLRARLGKLHPLLLMLLALGGFWLLSRGMTAGPGAIMGYAEQRIHNIGTLQPGRLKELKVTLGQTVHAGDTIAVLDTRLLELQRQRLQAVLRQAQAQLVAQQDIESSGLQRNQIQAVRAHAAEERSRAELRELSQQVTRMQALKAEHLIRASEIEAARRRQQTVAADLAARPTGTKRELELMGLRPRPQSDQEARLQDRLAPFRASIEVQEALLRETEQALSEMTLRAPVDGIVGSILQQQGNILIPGTPVVTLITSRPGYVEAFLPERQSRSLALGDRVKLRRTGLFAPPLPGKVVELAPLVEQAPPRVATNPSLPAFTRRIVVRLDSPTPLLAGEAFHVSTR